MSDRGRPAEYRVFGLVDANTGQLAFIGADPTPEFAKVSYGAELVGPVVVVRIGEGAIPLWMRRDRNRDRVAVT